MIVEFKTVKNDELEMYEEAKEMEKGKTMGYTPDLPFHNTQDWIGTFAVNVADVVGYSEGELWYNKEKLPCTYIRLKGEPHSWGLLIDVKKFKKLYEKVNQMAVPTAEELLKEGNDKDYPTKIGSWL